jgi:hypothetical protein
MDRTQTSDIEVRWIKRTPKSGKIESQIDIRCMVIIKSPPLVQSGLWNLNQHGIQPRRKY